MEILKEERSPSVHVFPFIVLLGSHVPDSLKLITDCITYSNAAVCLISCENTFDPSLGRKNSTNSKFVLITRLLPGAQAVHPRPVKKTQQEA